MKTVMTKNKLNVVLRSPKESDAKEIIDYYKIGGG